MPYPAAIAADAVPADHPGPVPAHGTHAVPAHRSEPIEPARSETAEAARGKPSRGRRRQREEAAAAARRTGFRQGMATSYDREALPGANSMRRALPAQSTRNSFG